MGIYTRVSSKDFDKLKEKTKPIIVVGEQDHTTYINNNIDIKSEDSEVIVRNTLEDIREIIEQWFIETYDFDRTTLRNFPILDDLIYHKDGWNLADAIDAHYAIYNKTRNKKILINSINRIIENESDRLCNTVFDELNDREKRFEFVTIGGECTCEQDSGICVPFQGTYKAKDHPDLPPYHWGCGCWAVWHD